MPIKGQSPLVVTPTKKEPRHKSCPFELCPCQDFQPDTAATAAIESDVQAGTLISWLSGAAVRKIVDERVKNPPHLCPNRVHTSIAILNAIRDSCRLYLENSATSPDAGASSSPNGDMHAHLSLIEKTTYEDSFPSLPSISSDSPPTLLVGRKKSKSLKIGVKMSHRPKHTNNQTSNSWNATKSETAVDNQSQKDVIATTPSGNATTASAPPSTSSTQIQQSFASLTVTDSESMPRYPKPSNHCSTDDEISTNDSKKVTNESAIYAGVDTFDLQKLDRLVLIYCAILRSQLAPSLLLELHLLLRLISLSDTNCTRKTTNAHKIQPYDEIFQCEQSCRDFAAKTLADLESVIVNFGHETLKMLVAFPALQTCCRGLCMTMQDIIDAGKSALIFDTDRKALGHNTNTPHLTLPFDHARDSRHNYRSAQMNLIFKQREELRDSFLFQLRAFQDIRGRLLEQEEAEKNIVSLQHASREILSSVSPRNTLWFVNFVCDLLLQTGLAPITETDSEVLQKIGDKKRLQVSSFAILVD